MYSLLFQQCDKEGDGLVDIHVILDYIQRLQLRMPEQEEEVFESHDSVSASDWSFFFPPILFLLCVFLV